jgi:hypothetical protein
VVFTACVEKVVPGAGGSVFLRLASGDSLDARVELDPRMFTGQGGSLLDYVRSVTEITATDNDAFGARRLGIAARIRRRAAIAGITPGAAR